MKVCYWSHLKCTEEEKHKRKEENTLFAEMHQMVLCARLKRLHSQIPRGMYMLRRQSDIRSAILDHESVPHDAEVLNVHCLLLPQSSSSLLALR